MRFVTLRRRLVGYFVGMTLIPVCGGIIAWRVLSPHTFGEDLRSMLQTQTAGHSILATTVLVWTIALVAQAFALIAAESLTRPLREMVAYANALASGDRTSALQIDSHDREFHALANTLNHLCNQLRTHEAQLQQQSSDAAKGALAMQVGHDMRSPTAVLRSFVQLLRAPTPPSNMREILQATEHAVEHLDAMALGLLDVARAKQVVRVQTDLCALATRVCNEVEHGLTDQQDVTLQIVAEHPLAAAVDPEKLHRVLANLLHNAVHALPAERSGSITITLADDHTHALVHVRDDGSGIAPEHLAKLFHKHFTTKGAQGTGLGLAYCKDVIDAHGGTLSVESRVGEGSCFTIRVPKRVAASVATSTDTATPAPLLQILKA